MLNLILVFLYKEWKIFTQFKFHKIINTLFYLTQIVVFYFLSKLISQEYFSFLFLGLLFSRVFSFIVSSFVETLKQEQYLQTINNLISLPYSEFIVLLSIFISKTCFMCIEFILLLLTGYFLGILFSFSQFILAFLWYIFLIFIFLWYAILSTGVSMLIRKAENLLPIINTTLDILSGVYFTPEILPFGLSLISKILPTTYTICFIREVILSKNINLALLFYPLITGILLLPVSVLVFNFILKKVLTDGSLTVY